MTMRVSDAGRAAIKRFEGCILQSYRDAAGVWTIGYGTTRLPGGPVTAGMQITQGEADALFDADLVFFESRVNELVTTPITQPMFDALTSFAYNVGAQALADSTLLRKLNAGDYHGAADEFARWNKAGGQVLDGLTKRRAAERALFLSQPAGPAEPAQPSSAPVPAPAPAAPAASPEYVDPMASPEERAAAEAWRRRTQSETPSTGAPTMPLPAIATAIATSLLPVVSDLFRARGSGTAARNAEILEAVAPVLNQVAQQVVPAAPNAAAAAEQIMGSRDLQQQFRGAVAMRWDEIAPAFEAGEKSTAAARKFALDGMGEAPLVRAFGLGLILFALSLGVVFGGGYLLGRVLFTDGTDLQTRGMIIGAIIAAATQVLSYFFGSSATSRQKDQTIAEQAARR